MISKFFSFLFGKRNQANQLPHDINDSTKQAATPTEQEVFSNPFLLAAWVNKFFLAGFPLGKDYDLLPNDENRAGLDITPEQRDRCLCEYSVLRAAGTSLLVKNHYDDVFWLKYTDLVTKYLHEHIRSVLTETTYDIVRSAVEDYVSAAFKNDGPAVALLYMRRVYDDNPNFIRMRTNGIGRFGHDVLIEHNDIMFDAYCQVMYGMSSDELEAQESSAASNK